MHIRRVLQGSVFLPHHPLHHSCRCRICSAVPPQIAYRLSADSSGSTFVSLRAETVPKCWHIIDMQSQHGRVDRRDRKVEAVCVP